MIFFWQLDQTAKKQKTKNNQKTLKTKKANISFVIEKAVQKAKLYLGRGHVKRPEKQQQQ